MSIESEAEKDLALSDEDAEGVAGGKKAKKAKSKAAPSHAVRYIQVPAYQGTPDTTLPDSDCDPDETAV